MSCPVFFIASIFLSIIACRLYLPISLANNVFYIHIDSQVTAAASSVYPKDAEAPQSGVEDMTRLAYLHEPGVLDNLRCRYDINEIYVSITENFHLVSLFSISLIAPFKPWVWLHIQDPRSFCLSQELALL